MKFLPVKMFFDLDELVFFKEIVYGSSSFNFDNFITSNQANNINLQHNMGYFYKTKLVLTEQSSLQEFQKV